MSKSVLDGFNNQPHIPFPSYSVTVNYDQTVEELIKAGKYDWLNDCVTSRNFPSNEKGTAEVTIHLVSINHDINREDAIKELDRQGLRPVTLKELLALDIAQPDLQRNNPIVALGSTWRDPFGYAFVPYLGNDVSSRNLSLSWRGLDWASDWRFAAVRK